MLRLCVGIETRFRAQGDWRPCVGIHEVWFEPPSISGDDAPLVLDGVAGRYTARRHWNGTIWAPALVSEGRDQVLNSFAEVPWRAQVRFGDLLGFEHVSLDLLPLFGTADGEPVGHVDVKKVEPGWNLLTAEASRVVGDSLVLIDGALWRRSGPPVFVVSVAEGEFMTVGIRDQHPSEEGPLRTTFSLLEQAEMERFRATLAARARPTVLPRFEIYMPQAVQRDEQAEFGRRLKVWLLRSMRRSGLGTLPSAALEALRTLRTTEEPKVILEAVVRLGRVLGVDTSRPGAAPLFHGNENGLESASECIGRLLQLPLRRIALFWPEIGALSDADADALDALDLPV